MKKKKTTIKGKKSINIFFKIIWIFFFLSIAAVIAIGAGISHGKIGYMPDIEDLNHPIDKYASQVISEDGVVMGTYSLVKNNRIYSKYSDIPESMVQALVSTEDERFYDHSGIDVISLIRVIGRTGLMGDKSGGGGSTITQQLAKQLYSPETSNMKERMLQKPIEWIIAAKLEKAFTKDEIINLYLNQFDFLHNAVGAQQAANVYFNKPLKDLSIEESATLIGMCKNPSYFNPVRRPEKTLERRNVVLGQMLRSEFLTKAEYDSLKQIPLKLDFNKKDHNEGVAPHFREYLRKTMNASKPDKSKYVDKEQFFGDSINWEENPLYGWINKNTKLDGSKYSLNTDGLKIYTTINSRTQQHAESAVEEHMKDLQILFDKEKVGSKYAPYARSVGDASFDSYMLKAMKNSDRYRNGKKAGKSETEILKSFKEPTEMKVFSWTGSVDTIMTPYDSIRHQKQFLRTGFIALDNNTGAVKAYVGDIDYDFFKFDMVNQSRRQIGSTFKPFLYTLAMQEGFTPCSPIVHQQRTYYDENGKPWTPKNASAKRVGETVTVKWGLQNSSNWITAYLMSRTSPYTLKDLLRTFGVKGNIDPVISMSLGSDGLTVAEMASAYTAFVNKGFRSEPLYVTRIEDQHGNIISEFTPRQQEVFSERTYMQMLDMLRSVIDGGTGSRLRFKYKIPGEMGGKTGTTQENADGWFMGFTPSLSTATWVGGEERNIRFGSMANGQGASSALPIYAKFIQKVFDDKELPYSPNEKFELIQGIDICPPNLPLGDSSSYDDESSYEIDDLFN